MTAETKFKRGQDVTIFEDPASEKRPEGTARLIKLLAQTISGALEFWTVEFKTDPGQYCNRLINPNGKNATGQTPDRAKANVGKDHPGKLYTHILNPENHVVLYLFVPMVGPGNQPDRTPFVQCFINPETGHRDYYVENGYHTKKQYKTWETASRALNLAIGELTMAGWKPAPELTGHYLRFTEQMTPGYSGHYFN